MVREHELINVNMKCNNQQGEWCIGKWERAAKMVL